MRILCSLLVLAEEGGGFLCDRDRICSLSLWLFFVNLQSQAWPGREPRERYNIEKLLVH